ncbi:MAG TPA: T9SS type A sorting domain-containing protein [Saprospiraceae bacterium]|nr:T9SS type A sorting domain-containing protein [Saprospiraceae bacterium]
MSARNTSVNAQVMLSAVSPALTSWLSSTYIGSSKWTKSLLRQSPIPNPTASDLHIRLRTLYGEDARLSLWSAEGKLVLQQNEFLSAGTNQINLPTSAFPSGTYVLRIEGKGWHNERQVVLH